MFMKRWTNSNWDMWWHDWGARRTRQQFFSTSISRSEEVLPDSPSANAIDDVLQQVKKHLNAINQVASLKAEINELNIEYKYLQQWQSQNLRPEELFFSQIPIFLTKNNRPDGLYSLPF